MATQIQYRHSNSTDDLYMIVIRDSDGFHVATASGTPESPTAASWTDYDIPLVQIDTTQLFQGTIPASTLAGHYTVYIFSGESPDVTDPMVGTTSSFYWSGTSIINLLLDSTGRVKTKGGRWM